MICEKDKSLFAAHGSTIKSACPTELHITYDMLCV